MARPLYSPVKARRFIGDDKFTGVMRISEQSDIKRDMILMIILLFRLRLAFTLYKDNLLTYLLTLHFPADIVDYH